MLKENIPDMGNSLCIGREAGDVMTFMENSKKTFLAGNRVYEGE